MPLIRVFRFDGMVPALDARLLPDTAAAFSKNAWLYSGAARGLPVPELLHTCSAPGVGRVFRIPNNYNDSSYLYDSVWLEFANQDTDVIRSPVFDDTFDRYYWASSAAAPRYNTRARIEAAEPAWLLGIPTPSTAPSVAVTGGSGANVTRSYVVTWVSAYGEEGAPSPPRVHTGKVDGSWNLTLPAPNGDDLGVNRNLKYVRIYRTIVSESSVATFFLVAELDMLDTGYDGSYSDIAADSVVAANSQLESLTWTPPPQDLQGFMMMPNGIVASWRNNELWFSEPYRPHAWPANYVLTVDFPIVGLGIFGQTLVVATQSTPYTASGITPDNITTAKLTTIEPCVSRGSIVSTTDGVYYASLNGLVLVTPGRVENITKELASKDAWQKLTRNTRLRAGRVGSAYYAFGSVQAGVFDTEAFDTEAFTQEDFSGALSGILLDPTNPRVGLSILGSEEAVEGLVTDVWTGETFLIRDSKVWWLNFTNPRALEPYTWRSKVFQTSVKGNLGALKVYFETPTVPAESYGTVRVFADDKLVLTRALPASGELIRMPSGFKADYYQIELADMAVRAFALHCGGSPKELRGV